MEVAGQESHRLRVVGEPVALLLPRGEPSRARRSDPVPTCTGHLMPTLRSTLLPAFFSLLAGCGGGERPATATTAAAGDGRYLFVFAGVGEHSMAGGGHVHDSTATADSAGRSDFLAVIDTDTASATYAQVVATAPIGAVGTMPHHIELEMPTGGRALFASAYAAGRAYRFDLTDPTRPRVAGTIDTVPGLRAPHSFVRLADGNVLATMQFSGDTAARGRPGGLALFSPEGRVVRSSSSADSAMPGAAIRTYALDVAPATDRVLTTSSPMDTERTADVVQLWRLSDLSLLRTIAVPPTTTDTMWRYPFELRFLADGKTAMMNTYYCAFYTLSGLDGEAPVMERVLALEYPRYNECGVPLLIGHWWIMPVTKAREFVVLDISDPRRPRVANTFATDSTFLPHWLSRDPASTRLVATSDGKPSSVRLMHFDSTSGRLSWDERFRDRADSSLGVRFERARWPHGASGRAVPHGAVFSRGAVSASR